MVTVLVTPGLDYVLCYGILIHDFPFSEILNTISISTTRFLGSSIESPVNKGLDLYSVNKCLHVHQRPLGMEWTPDRGGNLIAWQQNTNKGL